MRVKRVYYMINKRGLYAFFGRANHEQMLKIMFSDNPNLPEELYTFCNSIPNYVRAEREYLQIARQVADRLGYDLYNEFEEKLNDYMAQQLDACYLFGLGLRRELAAGLMLEE